MLQLQEAPARAASGRRPGPAVALVHDYLTQRGGAERVVLAMAKAFPGAPLHTSLYDADGTFPEFAALPVNTQAVDRVGSLRQRHRLALPFLATTFSRLFIQADVLLCSSSGWAHGARTSGRKVVYCHNPARWLYQADDYMPGKRRPARVGMAALQRRLLEWDRQSATTVDRYIVNSTIVRDRVRSVYGVDAEVLPPPALVQPSGPQRALAGVDPGFLLCVARLLPYKNVHAIVDAFAGLSDHRLVIVGTGPGLADLQSIAGDNVALVGNVADDELRWLYANAAGLVAASYEDFGLTPIEAAAFGTPAAVLRAGGFLDTMVEGTTGVFFDEPTPAAITASVQLLVRERWDPVAIRDHASRFSEDGFAGRLREVVAEEAQLAAARVPVPAKDLRPSGPKVASLAPNITQVVHRRWATKVALVSIDAVSVLVALAVAFLAWGSLRVESIEDFGATHLLAGVLALPLWLGALAYAGLYRSRNLTSTMEELRRLVRGVTIGVVGMAAASSVARLPVARLWLIFSFVAGVAVLGAERAAVRSVFRYQRTRGRMLRSVVIVGGNQEATELSAMFESDRSLGYRVVGFVADTVPKGVRAPDRTPHLGVIDKTLDAVRRTGASGAVIATTAVDHETSNRLLRQLTNAGVHVELSSSLRDIAARRLTVRPVGRFPIVYVEPTERRGWRAAAKRLFDVVVGGALLVVLAPLLSAAAIAIKATSRGPVLARQRCVGRLGSSFNLLRLRTTVDDPDAPVDGLRRDARSTGVGRPLRRYSLDELPQLWNVLRGDMSLVGPRPALPSQIAEWESELHARLWVRPGITGMWQISGRGDRRFEDYARLDLYYVENWSLWTDLAILARTLPAVLRGRED